MAPIWIFTNLCSGTAQDRLDDAQHVEVFVEGGKRSGLAACHGGDLFDLAGEHQRADRLVRQRVGRRLPGKPSAIRTCLDAVFAQVPYCIDLIGGARLDTDPARCRAFRPAR